MSRSTLFEGCSDAVLAAIEAGATIGEAATGAGTTKQTVNGWLSRGRKNPGSGYGEFAASVDRVFTERRLPSTVDRPADRDELMLLASKAARAGNVQAMRLLSELLEPAGEEGDALSEFDGKR